MTHPAGTWAYMPPEQRAAGRADAPAVAPAGDVFALAASLHAALTGQPSRPPRAASWGGLGALLAAALAPTPSERPTAAQLADRLCLNE